MAGLALRHFTMDIYEVQKIIDDIAGGLERACVDCMHANERQFKTAVEEQLYSGLDGEGKHLRPTYDDDPYFDRVRWFHWEDGVMYHGAEGYKIWKRKITPPEAGALIGLPPRPDAVPNLFIDGTFYQSIMTSQIPEGVRIETGGDTGKKIEDKYGSQIFSLSPDAVGWFNRTYMMPAIENFFKDCGYR